MYKKSPLAAFILACVTVLSGCMPSMPNNIRESSSKFDGSHEYRMSPGFIYESADTFSGAQLSLGLHWSSANKELVTIFAEIQGEIINIHSSEGLQFNVDGEYIKLSSNQVTTDFESSVSNGLVAKASSKPFTVKRDVLDKILSGEKVFVKLITNAGYVEGEFTADKPSAAIRGFREFSQKIAATK
jgi:hypothetical protein